MNPAEFLKWFTTFQHQAIIEKERRLVVLSGEIRWAISLLDTLRYEEAFNKKSHINDPLDKNVSLKEELPQDVWHFYGDHLSKEQLQKQGSEGLQNYHQLLGTESNIVVFADSQFNIDALAALSGTLIAGGILFILFPETTSSAVISKSLFFQRFVNYLNASKQHVVIEQQGGVRKNESYYHTLDDSENRVNLPHTPSVIAEHHHAHCKTQEQFYAVQRIIKVVTGHRNRPLILTADRGRGKSSALAIACGELLSKTEQHLHIVITAPSSKSLEIFFKQLKICLPMAQYYPSKVIHEYGIIEFLPIDEIIKKTPKVNLLLVDEAAGLPVYLLSVLLTLYHRIVFSSTIHGYEGAGRGFTIKFQAQVDKTYPQWQKFHINQPIRWRENDPLEAFIFDVCLLNAKLPDVDVDVDVNLKFKQKKITTIDNLATDEKSSLGFCQLSVPELLHDERLLRQVFAVLVTAHYQTKPSDLQLLLDNAQVRLFCIYHLLANNEKQILAVALIMNEGQRSSDDVLAVKNSTQRLRNEFIPQSLLTHCGIEQAFDFSYFRIMRIAVHPQCQQRGIGSFLLNKIESYAIQNKIDFIGASFGANEQLLKFWLLGDYQLARIGFSQDASSGEHSALVLKSLNKETAPVLKDIQYQFYRTFDYLLVDEYKHLSNSMVWLILHACPAIYLPKLSLVDINNINAFTNKERLFSSCVYSLHLWLLHHMTREFHLDVLPLISRVFKKNSIEDVCKQYQLSGKKSLNQLMINYLKDNI